VFFVVAFIGDTRESGTTQSISEFLQDRKTILMELSTTAPSCLGISPHSLSHRRVRRRTGFWLLTKYDKPENGGTGDGMITGAHAVFS
jgi:hypothetical protein